MIDHRGRSPGELVRRRLAEDMSDPRTRHNLQGAAALPHAKTKLQILPAPHVHTLVVGAEFVEVVAVDGEEAAGHGRGAQRLGTVVIAPHQLSVRCGVPAEIQLPIEAAPCHVGRGDVLERVVRDDVDDRADDAFLVLRDPRHQWLQPPFRCLNMSVQKQQHFSWKM